MNRILICIVMLLASVSLRAHRLPVIPAPAEYTAGDSFYNVPERFAVASVAGQPSSVAKNALEFFKFAGLEARKSSVSKADVKVALDASMKPESYKMNVNTDGIQIVAADKAALMYAVNTLSQLVATGEGSIAECTIEDFPRFGYRGLMLDLVRCYIKPEEIKRFIDVAALLKLNNLHLHLTDDNGWRLQIKKYPRLTDVGAWRVARPELFPGRLNARSADEETTEGGFYTQAEMRDIVKYAAARNINIIPEIEMPAHSAAAIASYPELACPVVDKFVGVFPGIGGKDASIILCAGKEETFEFIRNVLDEVMDIFPSKNIHLGGDEANKAVWKKCPLCNARIEKENLKDHEELQAYLMDRVNHYVRSKGRTAMGWDEVTYGDPKEEMIIYGWQGDGGVAVRDSRRSGRKFIMTPAKSTYLIRYQGPQWFEPWTYFGNITLKDAYNFEPVGSDWDDNLKSNLLGIQGSLWSEFCKTPADMQYQVFPRMLALADAAWRPEGTADWNGFLPAVDAFTCELEKRGVNYARSMFNLDHIVKPEKGAAIVNVSCIRPDVEIRYSASGAPSASSPLMMSDFRVEKPMKLCAASFKDGKQLGKTLELNLAFNKATGCKVDAPRCRNNLAYTLTNGLRASDRNSDFEWAGWWNETAEFTVDLGKEQPVGNISLGTLVHADICIAAPRCIYVYASENGNAFQLLRRVDIPEDMIYHTKAKVLDIDCGGCDTDARYLKFVAVNPGCIPDGLAREGTPTWMYFDEISVN